jgi:hypothetical protein
MAGLDPAIYLLKKMDTRTESGYGNGKAIGRTGDNHGG